MKKSTTNPLGGGIYIEVPYLAHAGVVKVKIKNAVRAPFFSARGFDKTTLEQWQETERHHPGPWADFESDKFMMQVPTQWVSNFNDPVTLMRDWDTSMEIAHLFGWKVLEEFWHSVNVDYLKGNEYNCNADATDNRILRLSQQAGADLTPLIHFWGDTCL